MANALKSASRGTLETVVGEGLKEVQRRQEKLASPDSTQRKNEVTLKSKFGGASPLTVTVGKGRSGLAEALTERNNLLDDLFTSETVLVENKNGEDKEKTLIYCKDVSELMLCLLES